MSFFQYFRPRLKFSTVECRRRWVHAHWRALLSVCEVQMFDRITLLLVGGCSWKLVLKFRKSETLYAAGGKFNDVEVRRVGN
jgi:hypothetical protein